MVDYRELPLVTDPIAAMEPGVARRCGTTCRTISASCGSAAMRRRPTRRCGPRRTWRGCSSPSRASPPTSMEPRGAWAEIGPDGRMVMHAAHQSPYNLRNGMANGNFNIKPTDIRVLTADVGGSFGMKSGVQAEYALVAWAARKVRPAGALDLRSHRGVPHRRAGARDAHHRGAWAGCASTSSPR